MTPVHLWASRDGCPQNVKCQGWVVAGVSEYVSVCVRVFKEKDVQAVLLQKHLCGKFVNYAPVLG